jgi:PAS domain S-box-containing protein
MIPMSNRTASEFQQELLAELEQPFWGEELFDCLTDLVFFIKNRRGEYVVVNQTLVERCGLKDKADLIGRTPNQVFPQPLGENFRLQDEAVLKTGEPIRNQLELHLYLSGAKGWCLTNKLPLRNRRGAIRGLMGVSKDIRAPGDGGEDYAQIAGAVRHMQTHFDEPLKVLDLANLAGMSAYQFDQRIRKIFQITTGQFLHKIRMEAAIRRLRETTEPIAAIAQVCGYSDQSAFTRHFKQTAGISPAQYRKTATAPTALLKGSP